MHDRTPDTIEATEDLFPTDPSGLPEVARPAVLELADIAVIEQTPLQDGRNMTMVLHPIKRPAKARAAAAPPPPTGNGSEGEQ